MPTYSYSCDKCSKDFELFFYIKDYIERPICVNCKSKKTHRLYVNDVITQNTSVKKSDNELKTIGDLANRNRDRMSQDEKQALYEKHNAYKENKIEDKPLPSGMSRMKKGSKTIWPT
jgi:putative FmdB family regulatory protein